MDEPDEYEMSDKSSYNSDVDNNAQLVPGQLDLGLPAVERGPPILTPIAKDLAVWGQAPWSVRAFLVGQSEHTSVCVSSSLWPGAHAISWDK